MSEPLQHRQAYLIESNAVLLRQSIEAIERLDDALWSASPREFPDQRVGAQFRHIIEFYECFFGGLTRAYVDYDARARDSSIERNRLVAVERLRAVLERIEMEPALHGDSMMWIRAEGAAHAGLADGFLTSTIGRELQVLASHTVHHLALIGFLLRLLGVAVPEEFGVAPSTLLWRAEAA